MRPPSLLEDEIHDRLRIVEAVGVVNSTGLVNDRDLRGSPWGELIHGFPRAAGFG